MKITIFGLGFVGKAVQAGFTKWGNKVTAVDPKLGLTKDKAFEGGDPEVVFICVPTPMGTNGIADTSIVESVFSSLVDYKGIVVLKSTVVPSVIKKLEKMHPRFVYNPEFLTEANAVHDFLHPFMHVVGGNKEDCDLILHLYEHCSNCNLPAAVHITTPVEASMIKYGINSFLAAKVMFMNQWHDLCNAVGADYNVVADGIGTDPRITKSHSMVPGPDGRFGTAGACFAKDIPAIIVESITQGSHLSILNNVWNSNCDIRNGYAQPLPREIEQNITFNKIL